MSARTRIHSKSLKKYNIGRPEKVVVTPDTPRSRKWKQRTEKQGYKSHEIHDYDPDEADLEVAAEPDAAEGARRRRRVV